MKKLVSIVALMVLTVLAPAAWASVSVDLIDTTNPGSPVDSGWTATLADNIHNGIIVDSVSAGYVHIEITKDFYNAPVNGVYTTNKIQFTQRLADGLTTPKILITDENIWNNTGSDWGDYHWWVTDSGVAFDKTATDNSGFSINPFTTKTWEAPPVGWTAAYSSELNVQGGIVHNGDFFTPGLDNGYLAIQVDLTNQQAASFTLYQAPAPEPATMAMLLCGVGMLIRRRRR